MSKSKKSKAKKAKAMKTKTTAPETTVAEMTAPEAEAPETAVSETPVSEATGTAPEAAAPETAEAPEAAEAEAPAPEAETAEADEQTQTVLTVDEASQAKAKTLKKLIFSLAAVLVLTLALCVTTFALTYAAVKVENNQFQTGEIKINLNDGKPVIRKDEYVFEPGMTVVKDFFIQNEGTWDVYYKIYFDDVVGGLANVLEIKIEDKDSGELFYQGTADGLTRRNAKVADDTLKPGQRRDMTITFYFPPEKGNETQLLGLDFTICAEATQTKNNPDKQF